MNRALRLSKLHIIPMCQIFSRLPQGNRYKTLSREYHLFPVAAKPGQLPRLGERIEKGLRTVAIAGDTDGNLPFSHSPQHSWGGVGRGAVPPGHGPSVDLAYDIFLRQLVQSLQNSGDIPRVTCIKEPVPLVEFGNEVKMTHNLAVGPFRHLPNQPVVVLGKGIEVPMVVL